MFGNAAADRLGTPFRLSFRVRSKHCGVTYVPVTSTDRHIALQIGCISAPLTVVSQPCAFLMPSSSCRRFSFTRGRSVRGRALRGRTVRGRPVRGPLPAAVLAVVAAIPLLESFESDRLLLSPTDSSSAAPPECCAASVAPPRRRSAVPQS